MSPLELLKAELYKMLSVVPRSLLPVEIREMEQDVLVTEHPIGQMLVFPLPLPQWHGDDRTVSHIVRTWGWEREGSLACLVEMPPEDRDNLRPETITHLNSRADLAGRFYQAMKNRTYYLNSQMICCKSMDKGGLVNLLAVRAARDAALHLVGYTLAGVVRDVSLAIDIIGKDNSPAYLDVSF